MKKRPASSAESSAAPKPKSRQLVRRGLAPPQRRGYDYKKHGKPRGSAPPDDFTIRQDGPRVSLVRPRFEEGSLIFRPLPCFETDENGNPTKEIAPYRYSEEAYAFSDFLRGYQSVKWMGLADEKFTFILYDKTDEEYIPKSNPYLVLYTAVKKAIKDKTAPRAWDALVGDRDAALPKPGELTFIQALVFKNGKDLFVGKDKSPRGAGKDDYTQIVQLPSSATGSLVRMFNKIKDENARTWEEMMEYGDPVDPDFGRFITIYNPEKEPIGGDTKVSEDLDSWSAGGGGGESDSSGEFRGKGYRAAIDDRLVINGKRTKIKPAIPASAMDMLRSRIVPWESVIRIPSHEEIALWIARALRGAREVLEYAWQDHEEFMTDEVKKVLKEAKQVALGGRIPGQPAGGGALDELEAWADEQTDGSRKSRKSGLVGGGKQKGRNVKPHDEDEVEEEEIELEVEEEVEGEEAEYEEEEYEEEDAEAEGEEEAEGDEEYEEEEEEDLEAEGEEEAEGDEEYEEEEDEEAEGEEEAEGDEEYEEEEEEEEEAEGEEDAEEEYEEDDAEEAEEEAVEEEFEEEEYEEEDAEAEGEEEPDEDEAEMAAAMEKARQRSLKRDAPTQPVVHKKKSAKKAPPAPVVKKKKAPEPAPAAPKKKSVKKKVSAPATPVPTKKAPTVKKKAAVKKKR